MGRNKLSKVSVFLGLFVLVVGANVFVLVKQRKKEGGDDNSQRVLGSMTGNKTQAKSHRARLRNTRTGLANADRRRNTHTKKKNTLYMAGGQRLFGCCTAEFTYPNNDCIPNVLFRKNLRSQLLLFCNWVEYWKCSCNFI